MKKYFAKAISDDFTWKNAGDSDVYLASDVDARIAELEKAIRDLHAEDFEWCQECGVGRTEAWARAKKTIGL